MAGRGAGSPSPQRQQQLPQQPQQPPPPPPLVHVRLRTFPVMMLTSALILTGEAFAINYISSPSPMEQLLKAGRYTVEYHHPLVAERTLELLKDWGLSQHNLRHIFHGKTPVQTQPHMPYHSAYAPSSLL